MSVSASLQLALAEMLGRDGALRTEVPILARREKELAAEIEKAAAQGSGLCALVMPPLPVSAIAEQPAVFFDRSELRVRLIEEPARNGSGVTAWQLADDVAAALQWQPREVGEDLGTLLAHPLQLAPRAIFTVSDARLRLVDVLFHATYQLPSRVVTAVPFTPAEVSVAEDLQAALVAQLSGAMATPGVPVLAERDHDLGSKIARSGHPLLIEVRPPRPSRAMQGVPFVFFETWRASVKITEKPALNGSGIDAYELVEDVAATLHWQAFAGFLAHPLQLAGSPCTLLDDPGERSLEVHFTATLGFDPE